MHSNKKRSFIYFKALKSNIKGEASVILPLLITRC